ncbi:MAG: S8 family serine peptidase [Gammaproteobacteria bacterium]
MAAGVSAAYAQGGSDVVLDRRELPDFVPDEVIVKLKAPEGVLSRAMISPMGLDTAPRRTSGGELIYELTDSEMSRLDAESPEAASDRVLEIAKQMSERPDVEYAQPNWLYQPLQTPNDPLYPKQWHYFNNGSGAGESPGGINLPKAWAVTKGSRSVVVTVIDTGLVMNHPDLDTNNVVPGFDFIDDLMRGNDGDGRDNDANDPGDAMKAGECGNNQPPRDYPSSWHGTHVSGTIGAGATNNGAGIAGINWEVKVQPVRVLGKCGGSTTDIADAIRWAAGLDVPNVPKNTTPAKVINMSLGGERPCKGGFLADTVSQNAINDAKAAGAAVVVAAGNGGRDGIGDDAAGSSPAGCDGVITVAASDPTGTITPFSNWGASVELMAPGGLTERCAKPEGGVLSMVARGGGTGACVVPDAYAFYNGTSMASPHVAGVAALMLAANSSLTPDQILQKLQSTAMPRTATQCPPSTPCGAGLMDANAAVQEGPGPGVIPLTVSMPTATLKLQLGQAGSTQATVKQGGTPVEGTTVNFSSSASNIASVTPASGVTDASGQAQVTVEGLAQGDAVISAKADGATAAQPARVPALSRFGLILLVAAVVLVSLLGRGAKAARK